MLHRCNVLISSIENGTWLHEYFPGEVNVRTIHLAYSNGNHYDSVVEIPSSPSNKSKTLEPKIVDKQSIARNLKEKANATKFE